MLQTRPHRHGVYIVARSCLTADVLFLLQILAIKSINLHRANRRVCRDLPARTTPSMAHTAGLRWPPFYFYYSSKSQALPKLPKSISLHRANRRVCKDLRCMYNTQYNDTYSRFTVASILPLIRSHRIFLTTQLREKYCPKKIFLFWFHTDLIPHQNWRRTIV